MIFLWIMALKIAYTDIREKRIKNHDLSLILLVSLLHHHLYQYKYAFLVLVLGFLLLKFIGAGDVKFLALIVLIKANATTTFRSLQFIASALAALALLYLAIHRNLRVRAPIGPALCVGLLI
jgi:Flp pilus assembly protein protease CpaA